MAVSPALQVESLLLTHWESLVQGMPGPQTRLFLLEHEWQKALFSHGNSLGVAAWHSMLKMGVVIDQ